MVTSTLSSNSIVGVPAELVRLIWGDNFESSIFERWSQPFLFSPYDRSALVQLEGGPCSVLTTVQAHLLRELIFCSRCSDQWRDASSDEVDLHFLNALVSILQLLSSLNKPIFLAHLEPLSSPSENELSNRANGDCSLSADEFHRRVKFVPCSSQIDVKQNVFARLKMWKQQYGVLLFLYSCLITKTVEQLRREIDDETSLPLIDIAHGHGSQCLTNLLITGVATSHCFDGDKDVEGLKLYGIPKQASIGFLSTLEVYRLLEVGWFLKNPQMPIWIVGSETHLTVVFSREQTLVEQVSKQEEQSPMKRALKIFRKYDTEKNGFITNSLLDQVILEMQESAIVSTIPTLSDLKQRMDPDGLQIITESAFLQELFPKENDEQFFKNQQLPAGPLTGKPFTLFHYNGLPRSNKDKQVRYASGQAVIADFGFGNETPASAIAPVVPGTYLPITGVLRTKWPTIELKWDDEMKPSLN